MKLLIFLWIFCGNFYFFYCNETDVSPQQKSIFYRIFYPILPWKFSTPEPIKSMTSSIKSNDLEQILNDLDTGYKINNGSLKMNDTELVVVENGSQSFRIIDDEHVIINDTQKMFSSTHPSTNPTTSKSQTKIFQRRFPITTTPKCEKFSEKQKYEKLESAGGRNQQFMANTPEEASKNFPPLISAQEIKPKENSAKIMSDAPHVFGTNSASTDGFCDETCEELKLKLQDALEDRQKQKVKNFMTLSDSGPPEVQEGKPDHWKGGCYLEKFIPVGNTSRGDEEIWGYEKLCTTCYGVYLLSEDCFPTFFNAVTCDKVENSCIFDQYTSMAHGKCQSKTLSFRIMRNKGTKECEEWVFEYIDIPIACECFLNKSSFLRSVPEL